VVNLTLTDGMINSGKKLLSILDKRNFSVNCAFWILTSDAPAWRLILAMPGLQSEGPKSVYMKLQKILNKELFEALTLNEISVLDINDPFIQLFRKALRTGPGISNIRFAQNTINGTYIPDALVYRLV
jgi:hypothetical protein